MKKLLVLAGFIACLFSTAQVGINTTDPSSTFDVSKSSLSNVPDGVLISRLTGDELKAKDALYLAAQQGTLVYVTAVSQTLTPKTSNVTTPGFYYYDNTISKWVNIIKDNNFPKFFYMPSVLINTTSLGPKTMNLYDIYYAQFNTPPVRSAGSAGRIPTRGRTELEYYVTYYDTSLLGNVSIDANGVMSYTVTGNPSDASFMNIVFVVK